VPYFHGVFALPARIADIAYQNKTVIYGILFETAADTRKPFIEQFVSGRTGDGCCRDCAIALFAISEFWQLFVTGHSFQELVQQCQP
jgi:hypothetical protein